MKRPGHAESEHHEPNQQNAEETKASAFPMRQHWLIWDGG